MEKNETKEQITLNGKVMSIEDFEVEKKSLFEKKIQIVETSKNTYVTRMLD